MFYKYGVRGMLDNLNDYDWMPEMTKFLYEMNPNYVPSYGDAEVKNPNGRKTPFDEAAQAQHRQALENHGKVTSYLATQAIAPGDDFPEDGPGEVPDNWIKPTIPEPAFVEPLEAHVGEAQPLQDEPEIKNEPKPAANFDLPDAQGTAESRGSGEEDDEGPDTLEEWQGREDDTQYIQSGVQSAQDRVGDERVGVPVEVEVPQQPFDFVAPEGAPAEVPVPDEARVPHLHQRGFAGGIGQMAETMNTISDTDWVPILARAIGDEMRDVARSLGQQNAQLVEYIVANTGRVPAPFTTDPAALNNISQAIGEAFAEQNRNIRQLMDEQRNGNNKLREMVEGEIGKQSKQFGKGLHETNERLKKIGGKLEKIESDLDDQKTSNLSTNDQLNLLRNAINDTRTALGGEQSARSRDYDSIMGQIDEIRNRPVSTPVDLTPIQAQINDFANELNRQRAADIEQVQQGIGQGFADLYNKHNETLANLSKFLSEMPNADKPAVVEAKAAVDETMQELATENPEPEKVMDALKKVEDKVAVVNEVVHEEEVERKVHVGQLTKKARNRIGGHKQDVQKRVIAPTPPSDGYQPKPKKAKPPTVEPTPVEENNTNVRVPDEIAPEPEKVVAEPDPVPEVVEPPTEDMSRVNDIMGEETRAVRTTEEEKRPVFAWSFIQRDLTDAEMHNEAVALMNRKSMSERLTASRSANRLMDLNAEHTRPVAKSLVNDLKKVKNRVQRKTFMVATKEQARATKMGLREVWGEKALPTALKNDLFAQSQMALSHIESVLGMTKEYEEAASSILPKDEEMNAQLKRKEPATLDDETSEPKPKKSRLLDKPKSALELFNEEFGSRKQNVQQTLRALQSAPIVHRMTTAAVDAESGNYEEAHRQLTALADERKKETKDAIDELAQITREEKESGVLDPSDPLYPKARAIKMREKLESSSNLFIKHSLNLMEQLNSLETESDRLDAVMDDVFDDPRLAKPEKAPENRREATQQLKRMRYMLAVVKQRTNNNETTPRQLKKVLKDTNDVAEQLIEGIKSQVTDPADPKGIAMVDETAKIQSELFNIQSQIHDFIQSREKYYESATESLDKNAREFEDYIKNFAISVYFEDNESLAVAKNEMAEGRDPVFKYINSFVDTYMGRWHQEFTKSLVGKDGVDATDKRAFETAAQQISQTLKEKFISARRSFMRRLEKGSQQAAEEDPNLPPEEATRPLTDDEKKEIEEAKEKYKGKIVAALKERLKRSVFDNVMDMMSVMDAFSSATGVRREVNAADLLRNAAASSDTHGYTDETKDDPNATAIAEDQERDDRPADAAKYSRPVAMANTGDLAKITSRKGLDRWMDDHPDLASKVEAQANNSLNEVRRFIENTDASKFREIAKNRDFQEAIKNFMTYGYSYFRAYYSDKDLQPDIFHLFSDDGNEMSPNRVKDMTGNPSLFMERSVTNEKTYTAVRYFVDKMGGEVYGDERPPKPKKEKKIKEIK